MPVQAWRDGDFSGIAGLVLKDPSTGLPFPGNRIPKNLFSKTATAAIALWPSRTSAAPLPHRKNLLVTAPDRFSDGLLTVKIDHELTGKDRLSGRYSRAPHDETTTPGLPTLRADHPAAQPDHLGELDPYLHAGAARRVPQFVHPIGVRAAQPEHGKGGVLRSVRHQQSAGGSAVRGRAQPDVHQCHPDGIRRRRLQHAARHFERVQLCRKRHLDTRKPRDQRPDSR